VQNVFDCPLTGFFANDENKFSRISSQKYVVPDSKTRELLEGLEAKLAKDEEKIASNQVAWEAEVRALKEKSENLLEDLNRRTEATQGLIESIRATANQEISTQCLMVKELCRAGNEDLR
jgi:hypothetical protein